MTDPSISYGPNGVVMTAIKNHGGRVEAETNSFMTDVITVYLKTKHDRDLFLFH